MRVVKEQLIASDINILLTGNGAPKLSGNKTVNLHSGMTASQIQALIDTQAKNLDGYTLTFQFGDGTYTLDNTLSFKHFFKGNLNIYGNTVGASNISLSNTKDVKLVFGATHGISVSNTFCKVTVKCFDIQIVNTGWKNGIFFTAVAGAQHLIQYNYVHSQNSGAGAGISAKSCYVLTYNNRFSSINTGIFSDNAMLYVDGSDSISALPDNGLQATNGGVIAKNGVVPTGGLTNQLTSTGGVVR